MKNKVIIIVSVVIISIIGVLIFLIVNKEPNEQKIKTLSEIEGYDLTLNEKDTNLFKEEFKILKENLENKEIDYEKYAESIAKLFIIDLYTISNKNNKYDVGGLQFVYPDGRDNFSLNVKDTIYKYVEDNSKNKRIQELPEVVSVNIAETKKDKFKIEEQEYDSFVFTMEWNYKKDLDYDNKGTVTVINDDNKMYVVSKD